MSSNDTEGEALLAQLREAAQDLATGSGLKMVRQWQDLKVNPMISCIALIRMAYTLAPGSVTGAGDGPEQFAQLCRLVAQKDGVLGDYARPL